MAAKGTRRGASSQRNARPLIPAWSFLIVGMLAGFFLGTLVPLSKVPATGADGAATVAKTTAAGKGEETPAKDSTRFDFYTLLPEREVIVPAEAPPSRTNRTAADPQPRQAVSYILQAGSFRRSQDADRRRAQVLLLGLEARIEEVNANGDRWHRVIVGPFEGRGPLDRARATLISENVDTLVLRQKSG